MAQIAIVVDIDPRQILELSEGGCPDSVTHKLERFTARVVNPAMREVFGEAFQSAYVEYKYDDDSWPLKNWECDHEQCTSCLHRLDCIANPDSFRPMAVTL